MKNISNDISMVVRNWERNLVREDIQSYLYSDMGLYNKVRRPVYMCMRPFIFLNHEMILLTLQ